MKALALRLLATLTTLIAVVVLSGAAAKPVKPAKPAHVLEPDKLVVLSTVDVKGKTSPCG